MTVSSKSLSEPSFGMSRNATPKERCVICHETATKKTCLLSKALFFPSPVDLKAMEAAVRSVDYDGLVWGTCKFKTG